MNKENSTNNSLNTLKQLNSKKILGKILATLRKTNAILYATVSQVSDIKLVDNVVTLVFTGKTSKEECEKSESITLLNNLVKSIHECLVVKCELIEEVKDNTNILKLLQDEFEDLLIVQSK